MIFTHQALAHHSLAFNLAKRHSKSITIFNVPEVFYANIPDHVKWFNGNRCTHDSAW